MTHNTKNMIFFTDNTKTDFFTHNAKKQEQLDIKLKQEKMDTLTIHATIKFEGVEKCCIECYL